MLTPPSSATPRYRELAEATIETLLATCPEWATWLGDHRFDDRIDDLSQQGLEATTAALWRHRTDLAAVDPSGLEPEDAVDLAMVMNEIDKRLFHYNELAVHTWDPLVYNPAESIYPLLSRSTIAPEPRLRAIVGRLGLLGGRLEAARHQLVAPPLMHVETALAQNAGALQLVREEVPRLAQEVPALRLLVDEAVDEAARAISEWGAFLEDQLHGIHRSPRLGPDLYSRKLALDLASPLSPATLLDQARQWMADVRHQLYEAAARYVGAGGTSDPKAQGEVIREALEVVASDRPGTSAGGKGAAGERAEEGRLLISALEEAVERCTIAVRSTGVVTIPDAQLRTKEMPSFRRGRGGAYCDPAGPLEEGGETVFCIEPPDENWTEEMKTSFYRENNLAALENLVVHEVMPGHMVQLAHSRNFEGSTIARNILYSGTFVEGWAVHAERLMAERGHGGLPVRLAQLKVQLRVAANAVIDCCVHAADMDQDAGMELMCEQTFQERAEAERKWRRACLTSAQLSTYFVGYHELVPVFESLGDGSNYDPLLAHGSPPPQLLAKLMG